jgi:hypothetical protein
MNKYEVSGKFHWKIWAAFQNNYILNSG